MPSAPKSKQPKPTAAHRRLEVFIGEWHAEGTSYGEGQDAADPRASGAPWTSDETYEWLPGKFFVLHRWDALVGKHEFKGAEIIGYDEAKASYFTRLFDNAGHHPEYRASVDGDVWNFKEPQTRATVTVQDGGAKMSFNWEWKNGGSHWLPLCDRVAARTQRADDAVATARACYQAYVAKDRAAIEALIADDFHFSSPLDNRLDRATYFTRCWPNSKTTEGFEFIHLVRGGERVFVTYEARGAGGHRFRNTEVVTVCGTQVVEVEVYFGWDLPHKASVGGFVDKA